jgi:hypothetical protein
LKNSLNRSWLRLYAMSRTQLQLALYLSKEELLYVRY